MEKCSHTIKIGARLLLASAAAAQRCGKHCAVSL